MFDKLLEAALAATTASSWLSNFGQLRRNTDRNQTHRNQTHRLAQITPAIALILTVRLARWAKRWNT